MLRKNPSLLTYAIAGVGALAAYKLFFAKKSEAAEVAKKSEAAPAAPPVQNFIPAFDPLAATPISQVIPVTATLPEVVPAAPVPAPAQVKVPVTYTPVAVAQPVFTPIGKDTGVQTLDNRYLRMIASPGEQSLPAYLGGKGLFQPTQALYMQTRPDPRVGAAPLTLADYLRLKQQIEAGLNPTFKVA